MFSEETMTLSLADGYDPTGTGNLATIILDIAYSLLTGKRSKAGNLMVYLVFSYDPKLGLSQCDNHFCNLIILY